MKRDILKSWNESAAKENIIDFVNSVTDKDSPHYVKPNHRIVTFDNDGTLWSEKPFYFQFQFAVDRIKEMSPAHPEWKDDPLFRAALDQDLKALLGFGMKGILKLVMVSHAGITTDEFDKTVKKWINSARHPEKGRLYKELIFQPMLELISYLHENDFLVYIVSGGGIEFMRSWSEEVYGIPPERIIGSSIKVNFEMSEKGPVLIRLPEVNFIDDKDGKPVGINQFIGKKPVMAVGNSDGDLQMMQWTDSGHGKRLMVYLHHTDGEREWAYDKDSPVGKLDKGLSEAAERNWTVIDMKNDWKVIYPFELNK
ncbi:MAG: haloacid dehalogenase-like hydrolase [Bacteroidetes bacterium]|nr:haloacid dehalogenase-like hydrolase [Bacteroidota bacterium]